MGILMDIQMAFESLDWDMLLNKITFSGVTGTEVERFKNFQNDRRQYVNNKDCESNLIWTFHGVPQGYVPSSVLLLTYINGFSKSFDCVKCILYADDTNLFLERDTSIIGCCSP